MSENVGLCQLMSFERVSLLSYIGNSLLVSPRRKMPQVPSLKGWFQLLARNRMHGPALSTAGIGIGLVVMSGGFLPWDQLVGQALEIIGLVQIGVSSMLFMCFAALQLYKSL
jgi:hypothetical protein